jgi:predicted RND superfamily exporter protein
MRERFFNWLANLIVNRTGSVLFVCLVITIILTAAIGRLGMKTSFVDMMPPDNPQAKEFVDITKEYASATGIIVVIESKQKDVPAMKKCADDLAGILKNIHTVQLSKDQNISFFKQMQAHSSHKPVPGVLYDTIPLVKRIDYKFDNEFLKEHGFIIQKKKDLENTIDMFASLELKQLLANINNNFEKEYVNDADNLTSIDGELQAIQGLEIMNDFLKSIGDYIDNGDSAAVKKAIEKFIAGPEYMVSSDNTLLILMVQPAVNIHEHYNEYLALGKMVTDTLRTLESSYPGLALGATGTPILFNDEMESSKKDFGWSSVIALLLILILLVGSFGTWKNPFYSVFTLVIALLWTTGLLALTLRFLNLLSMSFGIVLIGLGIDFSIHFISGIRDAREQGLGIKEAIREMYRKVGNGVITGAVTTSLVFFTLQLTGLKALSEMGFAIGAGVVLCLIAMMILLPTLIVWDNKGYSLTGNILRKMKLGFVCEAYSSIVSVIFRIFKTAPFQFLHKLLSFSFLERIGIFIAKIPVAIAIIVVTIFTVYLSIIGAHGLEFEYDMMELEAEGIPAAVNQDKLLDKFEMSPDFALVTVSSLEEGREKIRKLKKLGNKTELIGQIDGITEFLPSKEQQTENRTLIEPFREEIQTSSLPQEIKQDDIKGINDELVRFHQNIVEIGELSISSDGEDNKIIRKCDEIAGRKDEESSVLKLAKKIITTENNVEKLSAFQKVMAAELKANLLKSTSTDIVTLDNLPITIKERYISKDGNSYLITIFPKNHIWEERNLRQFQARTQKISSNITGMPIIAIGFFDLVGERGRLAIIYGAIAIIIFLLLDFRSLKYTLLAVIPLVVGTCWMLGGMVLLNMKLNYMNFMALPLILGIGIDDGVHILHRYHLEGRGSVPVILKYTGRAILLTSLTTMIGFGSMAFATMRGTASMGLVLVLGVGACFLSSAFVLPALISIYEKVFSNSKKKSK